MANRSRHSVDVEVLKYTRNKTAVLSSVFFHLLFPSFLFFSLLFDIVGGKSQKIRGDREYQHVLCRPYASTRNEHASSCDDDAERVRTSKRYIDRSVNTYEGTYTDGI